MKPIFIFCILSFILFFACEKSDEAKKEESSSKITVISVNYPLHFFAQKIGGDQIEAIYIIPAGEDPAYWKPDQEAIIVFQNADLILANGADYAKWMGKVSLPSSKVLTTSAAFKGKYIVLEEGTTHSHGPEGEHVHHGYAFTTWLDFKNALKQVEAIKNTLVKKMPEQKELLETNFNDLAKQLTALDEKMANLSSSLKTATLFGSHPVYQYLSVGYGLNILSEHWEPGEEPSSDQWRAFKDKLKKSPGNIMLWEAQPLTKVEQDLTKLGVKCAVFNPCANKPAQGDFISMMEQNIKNLNGAL